MSLLNRANAILRERYVAHMQKMRATGWENSTVADVQHLEIRNEELIAVILAIEDQIDDTATEVNAMKLRQGFADADRRHR